MSKSSNPVVSIIIPCYNYSHTISETINSVLDQTYPNWEALVIDDGSIDDTRRVVKSFLQKDNRIFYHYQQNKGLSAARNKGIKLAKGELLLFLDSDDILEPKLLEKFISKFMGSDDYTLIYSGVHYGTHDLTTIIASDVPKFDLQDAFSYLSKKNIAACHAIMIKASILDKVGNFDETLKSCEDWDLWLRVARVVDTFGVISEPLAIYRMNKNSMSRNPKVFFESGKIVLQRSMLKFDHRIKDQRSNLSLISDVEHRLAVVRWLMINTGTCIFNGDQRKAEELFNSEIKNYEDLIDAEQFKSMISYLSFTEGKIDSVINKFYKLNSKVLMSFLANQEGAFNMPGLAEQAFINVMSQAGYQWGSVIDNIATKNLLKMSLYRILNRFLKL